MTKLKSSPIKNIIVERNKKGIHTIKWDSPVKGTVVTIFAGDTPEKINRKVTVAKVKDRNSVKIDGLDPDARHYFEVVPEGGQGIITAERGQPFDGIVNFRDLGGYETTDGRRVKWGRIFRSGHLANASEKDRALFQKMGIRVICDFRSQGEKDAQPNWLPEDGSTTYLQYPIVHGEFDPVAAMESLQKGDASWLTEDFIIKRYLAKIDLFPQVWGEVLNMLADSKNRPLMFHCTAGKDRAGTCAAIILLALDVPEETVIYDHGLSNIYIADALKMINKRIKALGIDPDVVAPYFTAPRNAIIALVNHVRKAYGSAADYLKDKGGVSQNTLNELKRQLLE